MGNYIAILAVAATVMGGILGWTMMRHTSEADFATAEYHYNVYAKEAAGTGLNLTIRRLVDDPNNWAANTAQYPYANTAYRDGSFETTVTAIHADTVDIVSTGFVGVENHVVEARYAKGFTTTGVPPALTFAIISEDVLTLNGQAEIKGVNDQSNANIHTNGALTTNGKKVHIEGFGTFGPDGSGVVNPEKATDDVFDPNVDTNGPDPNLGGGPYIDIPDIDAESYRDDATLVTVGDTTLSGTIDFAQWGTDLGVIGGGTADSPFLMMIDGNLSISGNVTFLGYVQFVAKGTISISGDVTATTTPQPAKNAPEADWDAWNALNLEAAASTTIGFYSEGEITLSGGSTVVGQLYSNSEVTINGGGGEPTNILGGITSANVDINVNGGVNITYAQVSTSNLLPGWTNIVPDGVRLIAYAEW